MLPSPTTARQRTARRARRGTGVLAVAAAVLLLAGCISADQQTDMDNVNSARRSARLATVKADSAAAAKAQAWAQHMARTGVLEHTGGGTKLDTSGVTGWCRYGENVGKGPSLQGVHDAFMASPPHKANILGGWHRIGTGVYKSGRTYWVVEIFLRNSGTC